jgi:hypothetical protein
MWRRRFIWQQRFQQWKFQRKRQQFRGFRGRWKQRKFRWRFRLNFVYRLCKFAAS